MGFGTAAALGGALIWYIAVVATGYQIGFAAIGVGWLVGNASMIGAGYRRGIEVQLVSVLITAAAMVTSEYLIVRHFFNEYLTSIGYLPLPLFMSLDLMAEVVVEGIRSDSVTLLFWGVAVVAAFLVPRRRHLPIVKS
jgi:hypothetical protein